MEYCGGELCQLGWLGWGRAGSEQATSGGRQRDAEGCTACGGGGRELLACAAQGVAAASEVVLKPSA